MLLMKGNRNDAKQAYFNFVDVQNFVPGYKDVVEYIDKAKFEATLKVIVEQIPVPARYNLSGGFFQDKIEEFLTQPIHRHTFIKFYTPEEAKRRQSSLCGSDHAEFSLMIFQCGNSVLKEKEETVTKDSVKVGEAKVEVKCSGLQHCKSQAYNLSKGDDISNGLVKHDSRRCKNEWGIHTSKIQWRICMGKSVGTI